MDVVEGSRQRFRANCQFSVPDKQTSVLPLRPGSCTIESFGRAFFHACFFRTSRRLRNGGQITRPIRLVDAMIEPFHPGGRQVYLGVSIGISVAPGDGADVNILLKNAAMAERNTSTSC